MENVHDNFNDDGSNTEKFLINTTLSAMLEIVDKEKQGNIFVLDGAEARTSRILIEKGYSHYQIYCTNNTESALTLRGIIPNVFPISASDYFSGENKNLFHLPKFKAIYMDLCGGLNDIRMNVNKDVFSRLEDRSIIAATVCKRPKKNAINEATKHMISIIEENDFKAEFSFVHSYGQMGFLLFIVYKQIESIS